MFLTNTLSVIKNVHIVHISDMNLHFFFDINDVAKWQSLQMHIFVVTCTGEPSGVLIRAHAMVHFT